MPSLIWKRNTLRALGNVEKGLKAAHGGLDELQLIIDEARKQMYAGDHESVEAYVKKLQRALCVNIPLTLARESDLPRPWEV